MTTISNHPHPHASVHRWTGRLAVAGIIATIPATIGLVLIAFGLGAGLTLLMIPFLLGLSVWLFMLTSLYPSIAVQETGILLQPHGLPSRFLKWDELDTIVEHTMLKPPPPSKFKRPAHEGEMVIIKPEAAPFHYRVIGMFAGYNMKPVFAISNQSHVDYEALRDTLKAHIPSGKPNNA